MVQVIHTYITDLQITHKALLQVKSKALKCLFSIPLPGAGGMLNVQAASS